MASPLFLIALGVACGSLCLWLLADRRAGRMVVGQRLAVLARSPDASIRRPGWLWLAERGLTLGGADRREIAAKMQTAGHDGAGAVAAFALLRLLATLAGGAGGLLYARHAGAALLAPFLATGGAIALFLLAKLVLGARAAAGARRLNREMPFLLDMLLLLLESGNSLDQCFRYLVQNRVGGMEHTMHRLVALVDDLQKGMPYDQALDRWAERLGTFGARELAGLFKQSLLHGTEVGPSLREYAREFSERRLAAARNAIGRQATMMTIVMVLLLLPAVMIVLAGPAVVSLKGAMGHMNGSPGAAP